MQAEVDQNPAVRIARAFARGIGVVEGILCILFSSILFLATRSSQTRMFVWNFRILIDLFLNSRARLGA
jgi:hypothetical protein